MQEYLINFVVCLALFWVGFKVGRLHAIITIAKEVAGQIVQGKSEELLTIEKHGNLYFAYNQDHKFLSQGQDFVELLTNLKSRFPGKDFKIVKEQEGLSEEESGRMIKAIFEVFGEKNTKDQTA